MEDGHDVDGRNALQSDETAGILKQLKDEMSADLTAFKKKALDRNTNHHDLTKAGTEEIFVLTEAIAEKETAALKLEQSAKEWRRGHHLGETSATEAESLVWLAPSCLEHEATSQEGVKKFDFFMPTVRNTSADELERYGLFKKSKASVAKLNALNPEPVFGIASMSKNPINGVETIVGDGRVFKMTLDAHTFELVHQKTSLSTDDFCNHPEKIADVYYAEMVEMFKRSHHHQVSHREEECRRVMHRIRLLDC